MRGVSREGGGVRRRGGQRRRLRQRSTKGMMRSKMWEGEKGKREDKGGRMEGKELGNRAKKGGTRSPEHRGVYSIFLE